jgi:hypothetical protein
MLQANVVEEIGHTFCVQLLFFFENSFFYEIVLKILWNRTGHIMRIACWIPKATNTH